MTDTGRSAGRPEPSKRGGLLRQGFIAGWWTPFLDAHGPKNPIARFVVDLLPLITLFAVLAIVAMLAQR